MKPERHWKEIIPVFLLLAVCGLRLFGVFENFVFDIDVQYQALLANTIVKDFHVIWTGVSASNIGYYLGPGLVYLTALLLWLGKGDPLVLGYFASAVGCATVFSLYWVTKQFFSKRTALCATAIYGFSTFVVNYDRRFWPIFIPLFAIWIFYSLVKSRHNRRWLFLAVMLVSLAFHIHVTLFLFIPFIVFYFFRRVKKHRVSFGLKLLLPYILITSPLLVFDFFHNWDNMLTPLRFVQKMGQGGVAPFRHHFFQLFAGLNRIWINDSGSHILLQILLTAVTLAVIISLARPGKSAWHLNTWIITSFLVLYGLYPGPVQEYYLVFIMPFISLTAGRLLAKLPEEITAGILAVFIGINLLSSPLFRTNPQGLAVKKDLILQVNKYLSSKQATNNQQQGTGYYLDFDSEIDIQGWRYLFGAYGRKPAASRSDSQFGWLYPDEIKKEKPSLRVFVSDSSEWTGKEKPLAAFRNNTYAAYILDY